MRHLTRCSTLSRPRMNTPCYMVAVCALDRAFLTRQLELRPLVRMRRGYSRTAARHQRSISGAIDLNKPPDSARPFKYWFASGVLEQRADSVAARSGAPWRGGYLTCTHHHESASAKLGYAVTAREQISLLAGAKTVCGNLRRCHLRPSLQEGCRQGDLRPWPGRNGR